MVWSLGICVSAYSLEMQEDNKLRLLSTLNKFLDEDKVPPATFSNIPSLMFSITCFFTMDEMNQLVTETIERYSQLYCK